MKSKDQKRREAIERATIAYEVRNKESHGWSLQEYLNLFRKKSERTLEAE